MSSYESKTLVVEVIGAQGGIKRQTYKTDGPFFVVKKGGPKIGFKTKDVRPIWCPGLFRGSWKSGVMWRYGTEAALNPDAQDQFIPLLSMEGTKQYIDTQTANAAGSNKKAIESWQFWVLLIGIMAIAVLSALSLFGVHLNASTTTTIIQNSTLSTPIPTPIYVHP